MKYLVLLVLSCAPLYAVDMRPYSMSNASGDSRYVNVTGDTMTGDLTAPNITATYGLNASTLNLTGLASSSGKLNYKYNETADAADGTVYYSFVSSATVGPTSAASDGITNLLGRYRWYTGDNSNAVINGVEGVCSSYGLDESITCRGGMFRTYTSPGASIRTSIGADISARASYSGGTDITADSGTGFVGARIWMAPYFTAVSTPNINNFHGLWIYNEHATVPVTNGVFLSDAGGGFSKDITFQHGESIDNSADGTVLITAPALTASGTLTVTGNAFSVGGSTLVIANGIGGFGTAPTAGVKFYIKGDGTDNSTRSFALRNSDDSELVSFRNGGGIDFPFPTGYINVASTLTVAGNSFSVGTSTFVAENGKVWIGSSTTNTIPLNVYGPNITTYAGGYPFNTILVDNASMGIDTGGGIGFSGHDGVSPQRLYSGFHGGKENSTSGNYAGYLSFHTRINGGACTEKLRISSNGNVGIGTTNPATKLHMSSSTLTIDGNTSKSIDVNGYSKLGENSPTFKLVYLSTATGGAGATTTVAHGLTVGKILSINAVVDYSGNETSWATNNTTLPANLLFSAYADSTNINITTDATNSGLILNGKKVKISVAYTE